MQLFFNPNISSGTGRFTFDKEESRHIIKVLRKTTGDVLHVTDGRGGMFTCRVSHAADNKCEVEIVSVELSAERKYKLHLAVAPTKMNERFEWFLEKAVEIGISEITPLICQRSERQSVKTERFQKIILAAMKQSLQTHLPVLHEPVTFKEFLAHGSGRKFIAHCEETDKRSLKGSLSPGEDCTILIGPEGDFTSKEIQAAIEAGYAPVTLGQTRLRTETAAVVACHSVAYINETE